MYFISFHQFGMIAFRYCQTPKRDASVNTKTAPGSQMNGPGKSGFTIANCVVVCDLFIKLCEVEQNKILTVSAYAPAPNGCDQPMTVNMRIN